MHKIMLWFFNNLKNVAQLFSIICTLFIMFISLYWIESAVGVEWKWLGFIKPVLNAILDFFNALLPFSSVKTCGTTIEFKFLFAIIVFALLVSSSRFILSFFERLEDIYINLHNAHHKISENLLNKYLSKKVAKEQAKITQYMVLITTKLSDKVIHAGKSIDLDEQNKLMNDFIYSKTNKQHMALGGSFLYYFDSFNNIDNIIEVMFKVIKSEAPLDYAICIQAGDDLDMLKKLSGLGYYGKIIISADTLLRYKHNAIQKHETESLGIFQKENGTIEVHEFKEITG